MTTPDGGAHEMAGAAAPNGVAPSRPFVDGTTRSPAELRAEAAALAGAAGTQDARQHVEDVRAEIGETLGELASRADVRARLGARRDTAVAVVRARPVRSAAAAVALGALLVARRVRRRRR